MQFYISTSLYLYQTITQIMPTNPMPHWHCTAIWLRLCNSLYQNFHPASPTLSRICISSVRRVDMRDPVSVGLGNGWTITWAIDDPWIDISIEYFHGLLWENHIIMRYFSSDLTCSGHNIWNANPTKQKKSLFGCLLCGRRNHAHGEQKYIQTCFIQVMDGNGPADTWQSCYNTWTFSS